jgi:CheY-like chemotaxis protein
MPKKILLVEDHPATIEVMVLELEYLGYESIVAENGEEGIEKALTQMPDMIILDIAMPKMDGYVTAKKLKSDPRTKHIPILAATAKAMSGDRKKCLDSGCDDYIAKPFTPKELGKKIKETLTSDPVLQ